MARVSTSRSPSQRTPRSASSERDRPPDFDYRPFDWALWLPAILHMTFLAIIVLAMTPLTHNLDDIKMALFLFFGPIMGFVAILAMHHRTAPIPARPVILGLTSYAIVMLLSTLNSEHSWVGWQETTFFFAALGFFLGGVALGGSRETSRTFLVFVPALLLVVNLLGFFQYDIFDRGKTGTVWLADQIYGSARPARESLLWLLLLTFNKDARFSLMSTILNRDFYAAFCLLYYPMALALALGTRRRHFIALGLAAAVFSLISIFLCKSKGEYIFALASMALFAILFAVRVRKVEIPWPYLAAWLGGVAIFFGTFLFLNLPSLMSQLKTVNFSVSSRKIIFSGAVEIFKHFPILGGGPGTFVIYFPQFRSPDYFNHEISNVTERAHNYILDILSETGVLGAITFAIFALSLAYLAFAALWRTEDRRLKLMIIAILCGLLGFYGSNMTSTSGRWPIGAVGLWTFEGFLMGLICQARGFQVVDPDLRREQQRIGSGLKPIHLMIGLAALVVFFGVRQGYRSWTANLAHNEGLTYFDYVMGKHGDDVINPNIDQKTRAELTELMTKAANFFRKAISIEPGMVSSYYKLGSTENALANLQQGDRQKHLEASLEAYEDLHSLAPDYAEIHYNLGVVYFHIGRMAARKLAATPKEDTEARQKLIKEITELQERSLDHFNIMAEMSNKSDVLLNAGDTLMQAGDYRRAQNIFKRGIKLYPDEKIKDDEDRLFGDLYAEASKQLGDVKGQIEGLKAHFLAHPAEHTKLYDAIELASKNKLNTELDDLMALGLERNPVDPVLYEKEIAIGQERGQPQLMVDSGLKYVKLLRNEFLQEVVKTLGGANHEAILQAALAAEKLGQKDAARELYSFLSKFESPQSEKAREWLKNNP